MEMEYTDTNRRGKVVIIVGVVLAVVAGADVVLPDQPGAAVGRPGRAHEDAGRGGHSRDPGADARLPTTDVEVREVPLDDTNVNGVFTDGARTSSAACRPSRSSRAS